MKHRFIILVVSCLMALCAGSARADIVILKNGQVIEGVTITEEGDTLYCESTERSYYINKNSVESIIRTGKKSFREQAKAVIKSLPRQTRLLVKDYFTLVAAVICLLSLLLGLLVFKFLWVNIKPVFTSRARRRDIKNAVRQMDADEKSVLREFELQKANTLELPVEDAVVSGLINKGILSTTSDKGQYSPCGLLLPVTVSPTAKRRITPKAIGMPKDLNDEQVRDALARSRPQFMYKMAGFYRELEKKRPDEA